MTTSTGAAPRPAWRAVLGRLRPYRGGAAVGILLSLAASAGGLVLPLLTRRLIDRVADGGDVTAPVLMTVGLLAGGAVAGAFGWFLLDRIAITLVRDARRSLLSRLLRVDARTVDRLQPGDLLARLTTDAAALHMLAVEVLAGVGTNLPVIAVAITLMAYLDPVLLAVTLAVSVAAGVIMHVLSPRVQRSSLAAQEAVGAMAAAIERAIGAIRTIRANGAEAAEEAHLHAAVGLACTEAVRTSAWSTVAARATGMTFQLAFVAVLAVGGARVATEQLTVGALVAFLLYVFYLVMPMQNLVGAVAAYRVGIASVTRMGEVLEYPAEPVHPAPGTVRGGAPLDVRFASVRFAYRPGEEVLRALSFTAPAGAVTAIVGRSGAGKSTVLDLIERFYDHSAGEILLGGRDVRDWPVAELRHAIGYVEQDSPVLAGTLRDNLLLGAPNAGEAEIREVLGRARLTDLVAGLPEGLDTVVGHRGSTLSGGERQRVAIARALLRKPRLLLLDEATSHLDAENEAALLESIRDIAGTATVVVVAHRSSTVRLADRIVVLDGGAARATGDHEELAAGDALYAELVATRLTP
ncbi:ABC transporter ATP-binding protein [Nocardiopsis changdeensis]|uniref:ABC transporter ATP-binding protein n=1 Tax=Nocardiopsis TaxID=2013 RepID=UPI0021068FC5|nr:MULTISPECIES: ABC transporter ATP-binding protein [Nocardiopsis]